MFYTIFTAAVLAGTAFAQNVTYAVNGASGCITLPHIQALSHTFNYLSDNNTDAPNLLLPELPELYINSPSTCIPESLFDLYFDSVVKIAKQEDLLSDLDALLAIDSTSTPALHKRIRNCPQIKDAALSKAHSFSCNSAPHPDACRSCANFSTINFVASCVACAAKANQESIFCCAASATTFATYYSQVCLSK
ncbi:predicted protein [Colletotrichum tofieldiae]|uniref:Uncharacterized protein n=1 Tax=Colletotrichum liriopes TaxID=708192 RepID=A0AA37GBA5_9PEZI|nr:hypothetical protein ColLi_00350 [Colletotrichum liriopes]GKT55821.1 hypothetical protein ColTof3_03160 [Colletotrichum tofieldiae]GKT79341.1 predicted protein [Colletotrichum tofieldiae]GKT82512.1 hypothetical protein Ct61P_00362 [Colletotrichum tofieldiae]